MVDRIIRLLILLPLLPLLWGFVAETPSYLAAAGLEAVIYVVLGLVVYLAMHAIFWNGRVTFLQILEHELIHAAASLSLSEMPTRLEVDARKGGATYIPQSSGCFWMVLAPYFLPLFTLPLLPLALVVPAPWDHVIEFLIGFTLGFHYASVLAALLVVQTDITRMGVLFSAALILFFNAMVIVVIVAFASGDLASLGLYVQASWARAQALYGEIGPIVAALIER